MPTEPEVAGLLALIRLHRARAAARFDRRRSAWCCCKHQDRVLWDHEAINEPTGCWPAPPGSSRPGPYQLQAAIVACHAEAERWEDTDWEQIVAPLRHAASPRAVPGHPAAPGRRAALPPGPQAAMAELDTLAGELDRYHLYHATRADLLRELGRPDQARTADRRALALTANPAEQAVLQQRISGCYREETVSNDD